MTAWEHWVLLAAKLFRLRLPTFFLKFSKRWQCNLLADLLYNKTALSGVCIVPTTLSWSKNAVAHLFPMLYIPCLNFTAHSWVKLKTGIKSLATSPVRTPHLQSFSLHLKSFTHSRINLSPFTKDFRVRGTQIEPYNYFSELPTRKH